MTKRQQSKRMGSRAGSAIFVAVDHVSFRIGRGEIFGFLGSNGCGKTTTMKMMTGLLPVTEGSGKIIREADGADDMESAPETLATCRRRSRFTASLPCGKILELHAHLYLSSGK